jgi:hypothetical protein
MTYLKIISATFIMVAVNMIIYADKNGSLFGYDFETGKEQKLLTGQHAVLILIIHKI